MIIGTAGHIDHGKTSLVKALTSVDCDRLKEEKARGITIELGFAYWLRPSGEVIGFVDVPGHERLVRTMLAGATGIDFVLLVIAADDGVMPQTREHLAILDLLGLARGVVAMTKADLVDRQRREQVTSEIVSALRGTGLQDAEVVPVSAATGEGIERLAGAFDRAAAETHACSANGRFRLSIDRVFTLTGAGTTVTGTVQSGTVRIGDHVIVSPSGLTARVRSLHAHGTTASEARAGTRTALALAGPSVTTDRVRRGDVVLDPTLHAPVRRVDASLRVLTSERRPLKQWAAIRLHHAAVEITGRVLILGGGGIAPGKSGLVQILLDAPLAAAAGDRFVLRDISATRTIGGGVLLDLRAPERRRQTPERLAELALLRDRQPISALTEILAGPRGWVDIAVWMRDRAADLGAADAVASELGLIVIEAGGVRAAFLPERWQALRDEIGARLDAVHAENPDLPGLAQERLRLALRPRLPAPLFGAAVQHFAAEGTLRIDRSWLRRPWHEVRFSPEEEEVWGEIATHLSGRQRFRPPRVRDIAIARGVNEAWLRRLFRLAVRRGDVEEVARDHFFLAETVSEMADAVRELAGSTPDGQFGIAAFRDRLNNGRKVAIQILEFFDRQGLTMRRGDIRRINPYRRELYSRCGENAASLSGGETSPVGRPDFKSGRGRETVPGGFDSRLLRHSADDLFS